MLITSRELKLDSRLVKQLTDKFMTDEYKYPSDEHFKKLNLADDGRIYSSWDKMSVPHFPDDVEQWYHQVIKSFLTEYGLYGRIEAVNSKWCQIYTSATGGHNVHTHYCGQEFFSWVHFVQTPKDQKCFFFVDSNSEKIYPQKEKVMTHSLIEY